MIKATRARYTLEFKQEAVRLVESGQSIAAASWARRESRTAAGTHRRLSVVGHLVQRLRALANLPHRVRERLPLGGRQRL
jgi:transposase-like protein